MRRWMYVTDSHGDLIDPRARDAALGFMRKFKPEIRVHGGDAFDLRPLGKKATDEDKQQGIADDIEAGMKFLRAYKPTVFLWGNHDLRLIETANKAASGDLRNYCTLLHNQIMDTLDGMGCEVLPYDVKHGVYRLGDYNLVHGYCANMHTAHKAAQIYGNVIMGHVHRFQMAKPQRYDGATGYTCGCLMDPELATYARRSPSTLTWEQGWMYGWITDDDKLIVQSVRQIAGRWMVPQTFKEL